MAGAGWGSIPWGLGPWGAGATLQLIDALAIRENQVRITFNVPLKFTGVLDVGDGSEPERYAIATVPGTVGMDGNPVRAVGVVRVELVDGSETQVNVTLDRPMTPYPARYTVSVSGLLTAGGDAIDPAFTSFTFDAAYRGLSPNLPGSAKPSRDIASPDDAAALVALQAGTPTVLGVFVADESGDYASDAAKTSWRKRVIRRCTTRKGSFAHLPGYGVGLVDEVKQLAKSSTRSRIEEEAEAQIRAEPETVEASAVFSQDATAPEVWRLRIRAVGNTGESLDDLLSVGEE